MTTSTSESSSIHYRSGPRHRSLMVTYGIVGMVSGLLCGFLIAAFWRYRIVVGGDGPIGLGIALHASLLFPAAALYRSATQCTDVHADEEGLTITTCCLLPFAVPWRDVVGMRVLPELPYSVSPDQGVEEHAVSIRKGLTVLHSDLARDSAGKWRLGRAFVLRSDADGYAALVKAIEMRTVSVSGEHKPHEG